MARLRPPRMSSTPWWPGSPRAMPGQLVEAVGRWKHLTALSQSAQEDVLTKSVVDKSRRQIGLFTVILLAVSSVIIALILYTMTMTRCVRSPPSSSSAAGRHHHNIIQEAVAMAVIGFSWAPCSSTSPRTSFPGG